MSMILSGSALPDITHTRNRMLANNGEKLFA